MNDKTIAPRVTLEDIESNIVSEYFFTASHGIEGEAQSRRIYEAAVNEGKLFESPIPVSYEMSLDLLTFCVLVLKNGFMVTGESACVSPENFDVELGKSIAREKAIEKVWPLMGYQLRSNLTK